MEIYVSRQNVFDRNLTLLTQKKLAGIVYTLKMTSLWYNLFFLSCVWFSKKLQQKWTSKTVNLIEGNKLQTFFKVYIFNHHGNKVKIFKDLQNNLLATHGSTWVLNILTSCLWFRRVKTSWKTVVDLSRGNHTKCPKFQTIAQKSSRCKFYPWYLVTRTGDREICAVSMLVSGWPMDKPGT